MNYKIKIIQQTSLWTYLEIDPFVDHVLIELVSLSNRQIIDVQNLLVPSYQEHFQYKPYKAVHQVLHDYVCDPFD